MNNAEKAQQIVAKNIYMTIASASLSGIPMVDREILMPRLALILRT
jgi:hypothetical protein